MPHNTAAGESIRNLRNIAGLTLDDVAELVPTSTSYLSRVETGKVQPTHFWIGKVTAVIADVLVEKRRTNAA